ncbi:hypothetical protein [Colwellia sp. TT2012]|uniref:hypothetical protein n=1 Tax=Colwellia sp. TT2012 TaxID=1720342 RepID=UPI00070FD3A2|nr:hypothetical protein [Colwellia sp. TT2012]
MDVELNWRAISAVITTIAVIVALIPLYQSGLRNKAKAKNLRIRIAAKIFSLKPTLVSICEGKDYKFNPLVIFTPTKLDEFLSDLTGLMKEAEVLEPDEQDLLSSYYINVELMIPLIKGEQLEKKGAESIQMIADRLTNTMEDYGLLHSEPHQPWK